MQAIVPEDQNLPGWVPKNYIEKGAFAVFDDFKCVADHLLCFCLCFSGGHLRLLCG